MVAVCRADGPKTLAVRPGSVWTDTRGNVIQSHGGGILRVGNVYYWFGECRLDNKASPAVRCYWSTDLKNWTFCGTVLSTQSSSAIANANFERPKVLYNEQTRKFVLWAHKENAKDYNEAPALVATCDTPDGHYTYLKDFRPFGNESRDCTLFEDDDGTAYFISTANDNTDLMCYKLTADFLDVKEQSVLLKEAPPRSAGGLQAERCVLPGHFGSHLVESELQYVRDVPGDRRPLWPAVGPVQPEDVEHVLFAVSLRVAGRGHRRDDICVYGRPLEGLESARFAVHVSSRPIPRGRNHRAAGMARRMGHRRGNRRMCLSRGPQIGGAEHCPRKAMHCQRPK